MTVQLEFDAIGLDDEELKEYILKKQVDSLKVQVGNLRRGIFSRHAEHEKIIATQMKEIEKLQSEIKMLRVEMGI